MRGWVFIFASFLYNGLMNILQDIFNDHYEEMIYILHPRKSVVENVDKMIHCGDPSYGGAMYCCPDCNEWKFQKVASLMMDSGEM